MKSKKAFTLIELLVVIAIIGILATISVIALNNARAKSRDAKRIGDIKQVSTALELFFNDKNRYPTVEEWNTGQIFSTTTGATSTYMQIIPAAPTPNDGSCTTGQNTISYTPTLDGASYTVSFCLGNTTGALDSGPKCLTPGGVLDVDCSITIPAAPSFACGTDSVTYEGEVYPTVYIDNTGGHNLSLPGQCWFAKNLNVGTMVAGAANQADNGIIEKYCYNDNTSNECATDGGLYQWDEAMQYSVAESAQGICPDGWHLPTDAEQNTLDQNLNDTTCNANRTGDWGCANAGTKLQDGGTSGLNVLRAGTRYINAAFYARGVYTIFWSSSISGSAAWGRNVTTNNAAVYRNSYDRTTGYSVRCLQD
ncbi:MAG TPA: FISUMP domain-containing protein [bacterium]|nr:FISUMP domain-containing protein [bacterium]HPT29519.1 FISUMP domain-containing protein [bacterium]